MRWRRFRGKPVRRLRRFVRRKGHRRLLRRGGKGAGKSVRMHLAKEVMQEYAATTGRGMSRSSGKGFGRKGNPKGRDGRPLKCHICGSEEHLQAKCPQGQGSHYAGELEMFPSLSALAVPTTSASSSGTQGRSTGPLVRGRSASPMPPAARDPRPNSTPQAAPKPKATCSTPDTHVHAFRYNCRTCWTRLLTL